MTTHPDVIEGAHRLTADYSIDESDKAEKHILRYLH